MLLQQNNQLVDRFNRQFSYLRLSLTEKCNFKCQYCLPNGYESKQKNTFLTLSEITYLLQTFIPLGIKKIRLTGGEPTLRKDFNAILNHISHYSELDEIALTTNGFRLYDHIETWRHSKLKTINVSIDSLDPVIFKQITGDDRFQLILNGIEKTLNFPDIQLKINTVLLKNLNDTLDPYLNFIRHRNIEWRFIELMETNLFKQNFQNYHISGTFFEQQLIQQGWKEQPRKFNSGPAKIFKHPDYLGKIGLIMPYSKDFCLTCNRLRVAANGKLHYCLFGESAFDLRPFLQNESSQPELKQFILNSLKIKPKSHYLQDHKSGLIQNLSLIGG